MDLAISMVQVRSGDAAEIDQLARLWHDAWHEAHVPLQPPELIRLRTPESFRERLRAALPDIWRTSSGPFPLEVWRYEKRLARSA